MSRSRRHHAVGLALLLAVPALAGACTAKGEGTGLSTGTTAPGVSTTVAESTTTADRPTTTERTTTTEDRTTTTSDGGGTGKDAFVAALADSLIAKKDGDLPIDATQAKCLAPKWVDAIGFSKLLDAGVSASDLGSGDGADTSDAINELIDRPTATTMVGAFGTCGIDLNKVFVDSIAGSSGLTPTQATCLMGALPDGFVEKLLVISLADGSSALDADPTLEKTLADAAAGCRN